MGEDLKHGLGKVFAQVTLKLNMCITEVEVRFPPTPPPPDSHGLIGLVGRTCLSENGGFSYLRYSSI